jgi:hypothetical protein
MCPLANCIVRNGQSVASWCEVARRAAILYSLIGSAQLNGLDPESYLRDVFTRMADHPICRIEELPPWNLTPSRSRAVELTA